MKICNQCVLPESFPGIRFDSEGVCQYCARHSAAGDGEQLKARYLSKFQEVISGLRGKGPYDVLLAFSGGKDSTYTLKVLREQYGLRVLAFTFNHGFVSPQAITNIATVTGVLGVDHLMFSPNPKMLCHAFKESMEKELYSLKELQRASSICNTCMHLVKAALLKTAVEQTIPIIALGWSPGQAPIQSSVTRLQPGLLRQTQESVASRLRSVLGEAERGFFLQEEHFRTIETMAEGGIHYVHPMALIDYNEKDVVREIEKLGWKHPSDTDSNSSNCLMNGFANQVHQERYGFHPYAFEIAGLVRDGAMSREEGLEKLSVPVDARVVDLVRKGLGLA